MNTTYIYVLKCPISFEVKYVGKANNPKLRYYSHLNTSKSCPSILTTQPSSGSLDLHI